MKPKKNKVFCKNCERVKMLFDTEKRANNFITFNKEEIKAEKGIAPERSYFCEFCGGWHITSMKTKIGQTKNEKLLEVFIKENTEKKEKKKAMAELLEMGKLEKKQRNAERRSQLKLELENEVESKDLPQLELFFTEKIEQLQKDIEALSKDTSTTEMENIKELRIKLEITNIVRKQKGVRNPIKIDKKAELLKAKNDEEWLSWFEKQGYKKQ